MLASRRLLVSQYHVLMLRHKQTLYSSQRLHSLRLYNAALTEASASTPKDMSEPLSQKEKQKQDKADKKLKQRIRKTLPKPKRNTPARTPDLKQLGKEKSVPNTDTE